MARRRGVFLFVVVNLRRHPPECLLVMVSCPLLCIVIYGGIVIIIRWVEMRRIVVDVDALTF